MLCFVAGPDCPCCGSKALWSKGILHAIVVLRRLSTVEGKKRRKATKRRSTRAARGDVSRRACVCCLSELLCPQRRGGVGGGQIKCVQCVARCCPSVWCVAQAQVGLSIWYVDQFDLHIWCAEQPDLCFCPWKKASQTRSKNLDKSCCTDFSLLHRRHNVSHVLFLLWSPRRECPWYFFKVLKY